MRFIASLTILLVLAAEASATSPQVTFDDTKEGLFAFRMINSMRENETGHVVNNSTNSPLLFSAPWSTLQMNSVRRS